MALNLRLNHLTRILSSKLCLVSENHSISTKFKLARTWYISAQHKIHTTAQRCSLMEFFELEKNWGETKIKSGRAWKIDELRIKSNSDLHKLWFVLYKERNMLLTMQEAAKEECESFASPERIDKVEESMANLEEVVRERNQAYWQLEVSPQATGERRSVYRRDIFGRQRWHKCSQHLIPYHMNTKFRNSQGAGKTSETDWFFRRYREQQIADYNGARMRRVIRIRNLLRRFPNADVDYIEELNPDLPQGYVKWLRDNLDQYDDRLPSSMNGKNLKGAISELNSQKPDLR